MQRILSFYQPKITVYLLNARDSHILSTKNNSVFAYADGINLSCRNSDITLTKFWTTGPWSIILTTQNQEAASKS